MLGLELNQFYFIHSGRKECCCSVAEGNAIYVLAVPLTIYLSVVGGLHDKQKHDPSKCMYNCKKNWRLDVHLKVGAWVVVDRTGHLGNGFQLKLSTEHVSVLLVF